MPYIALNTTVSLSEAKKEEIKAELGRLIAILPGKSERVLMIDFGDGHTMYFRGEKKERCAFVEIRLFGVSPMDEKSTLTAEIAAMLQKTAGIAPEDVFINIVEYSNWGSNGVFR